MELAYSIIPIPLGSSSLSPGIYIVVVVPVTIIYGLLTQSIHFMKEFYRFYSVAFLFLTLLASLPSMAQVQTPREISTSANSGGFYEYLPAGYATGTQSYPLMVYLAGSGELGNGTTDLPLMLHNGPPFLISQGVFPTSFTVDGNTLSFIVISPQFKSSAQPNEIDAVISYAIAHYRVDASRIYLTAISLGGGAIWGYASLVQDFPPHKLAALLPVSGAGLLDAPGGQNIANNHIAVYATHNLNDPTVPSSWTLQNIAKIDAAIPPDPITPIDTIFNVSGHDAWTKTFDPTFVNPRVGNLNVYQWMLQFQSTGIILPVTLTDYKATLSNDHSSVTIDWTTATEENSKYFILQRSADGHQFSDLDTIAAANLALGHVYSTIDQTPLEGNNFYRLSQVDNDGKTTLFGVLEVTVSAATAAASAFHLAPNPARNTINLELINPELGTLQVRLSDAQGKIMRVWRFSKQQLDWDQALDISNIPPGNYFITVEGGNTIKEVKQFIKE
jgi:Secretion system C-terminal sorting domain